MIKVTSLLENTTCNRVCVPKHGLSIYVETSIHKLLFDLGPDDTFFHNAKKLGIDIKEVDTVIISHGHFDHTGGLKRFLKENTKAKIYIKKEAFKKHYTSLGVLKIDIGIKNIDIPSSRVVYTSDFLRIDEELTLFSNVSPRALISSMNNSLYLKDDKGKYIKDDFTDEQYLIIKDNNKDVLISGCSHKGIINIIEKYEDIKNNDTNLISVIGGFHLFDPVSKRYEDEEKIVILGDYLANRKEKYYTCHCTGKRAFNTLRKRTEGKVSYLSCGDSLSIN